MAFEYGEQRDKEGNITHKGSWSGKDSPKQIIEQIIENFRALRDEGITADIGEELIEQLTKESKTYTDTAIKDITGDITCAIEEMKIQINTASFATCADMISQENLKAGMMIETKGYKETGDGGAASYLIVDSDKNTPWAIKLNNGLFAAIAEKERVNYKMFGACLDGINDDGPAMYNCHKYADSLFTYDEAGHIKQYLCKVENHQGIIYKKNTEAIACFSDVDLSGSTLLIDDTNATWFGIYVWGDVNSIYYDYEIPDDIKLSFEADRFVIQMHSADSLPPNTVLKIEENPYAARDDAGYLYTVPRRELIIHDMNGICSSALADDWAHAGGEEINCQVTNLIDGTVTTQQSFTRFKASYTYIPSVHGTFTGCDVKLNMSADKYCTVLWCKRHNATVQNFIFRPNANELHNTAFKNAMIYLWDSYNVTVKNLQGFNASGKQSDGQNGTSGYMLRITNCTDVHIEDCRMQGYWGATAMDSVKNIFFKRCHLNRLDIHDYFSNLYADNCTFYNHSIQIGYGKGMASFTNSLFFWNEIKDDSYPSSHLLEFNCTYGRIFEGSVYIDHCRVVTKKPPDNEFNIFKASFSPEATTITKHFKFPEIICKNLYIYTDDPNTHLAYIKISGTRRATTSMTPPSHIYGISNEGTVTWQYYGRGVNWGEDKKEIAINEILRVTDTFMDKEKKTQFYNRRYYICTQAGTLDFSGNKPQNQYGAEFTCGTAKLRYEPEILWKAKHNYAVGDLCAVNQSNFYPLYLFKCIKAGTSNGLTPTHTLGTVLEGINDPIHEPDDCWWTYIANKSSWCIAWEANMNAVIGQRILAEGRIYEVVKDGQLTQYPPHDTMWFGESDCGTTVLKYIGASWEHNTWYAKDSFCETRGNIYQLERHSGITSGSLPTRGNPYCVDGDVIWEYKSSAETETAFTDTVTWESAKPYDTGTLVQVENRVYEVQRGTSGSSLPGGISIGSIFMDGSIVLEYIGEYPDAWRVAGNAYNVGDIIMDNTFVVQCITAGQTNQSNKWGPLESAAWASDGTFQDGECKWKKLTPTAADGAWRSSYTKYKTGMILLVSSASGKTYLYKSLPGTSGANMPVNTSGTEFMDGSLILKYLGIAVKEWKPNAAYNQGELVKANNNIYECSFDGKMIVPQKTVFEDITTNINNGHIFWFSTGTNIPTRQEGRAWKIIAKNCDAIDDKSEGLPENMPYFGHGENPNPLITVT